MNNIKMNIWGREFELAIEYDCYSDEKILPIQEEALESFIEASNIISQSKVDVEQYCLINNRDEIGSESIDNIFKYVIPKYILVKRNMQNHVVAIMCNYRYDTEHGIAIVFENNKLLKIGKQDIIL